MRRLRPIPQPTPPRGGTTLTEVLMAILCMGIGVVAVASLFPIALLRSVQATQLTHGTILRYNAETLVDLNPSMVFDPDGDDNFVEHTLGPSIANTSNKEGKNYLIDPLGWNIINSDVGAASANLVGKMPRFNIGLTPEKTAEAFVTLPDSWVMLQESIAVDNNASSVDLEDPIIQDVFDTFDAFDTNTDGTLTTAETGGDLLRVVLFHDNGRVSESRVIRDRSQISGSRVQWSTRPLPGSYNSSIERVRIEVRERRYTWLLTVRNFTTDTAVPQALVDVVIFFRRSPSVEDETAYDLISGSSRSYTVDGTPSLSKGDFMLDTNTGAWHRVQKIDDSSGNTVITLERNTDGLLIGHSVVFMRGVIEVYPLGTKP